MTTEDHELTAVCDDIRGRQRFLGAPKHVADLLSSLMSRRGYAQVKSASDCGSAWQKAAGPELAKDSRVGDVRRGILEVMVRNSVLLQELTFQKRQLIKQLGRLAPEHKIRDIRFRVGSID